MFCALRTLLQYFKNIKPGGGLFCPPVGGAKQFPCFIFLEVVRKRFCRTKHAYIVLGCIAYLFNRGVDASQVTLLKKALSSVYHADSETWIGTREL